jgi:hypothetical protein
MLRATPIFMGLVGLWVDVFAVYLEWLSWEIDCIRSLFSVLHLHRESNTGIKD